MPGKRRHLFYVEPSSVIHDRKYEFILGEMNQNFNLRRLSMMNCIGDGLLNDKQK